MDRRVQFLIGAAALLVVIVLVVVLARGGDENGDAGDSASADGKPEVTIPEGDPPETLEIEDITVGEGPEAQAGDNVTVDYVGVLFDNGEEFDSSYNSGQPFQFQLGAGMVIPGWDEGVAGMKAGGRRQLVIPPDMAYGESGAPPSIPPNATLVFVVDLRSIDNPAEEQGGGQGG